MRRVVNWFATPLCARHALQAFIVTMPAEWEGGDGDCVMLLFFGVIYRKLEFGSDCLRYTHVYIYRCVYVCFFVNPLNTDWANIRQDFQDFQDFQDWASHLYPVKPVNPD